MNTLTTLGTGEAAWNADVCWSARDELIALAAELRSIDLTTWRSVSASVVSETISRIARDIESAAHEAADAADEWRASA